MSEINSLNSMSNESIEFGNKPDISNNNSIHNSLFDKNKNGVIEIAEQKAGIMSTLNKLLDSDINECFNSNIKYNKSDANSIKEADTQVKARQQKAITLAESTKYFNQKILDKGSEVFYDKDGNEVMGYTLQYGEKIEFSTDYKNDKSYVRRYSDDSKRYYSPTGQWVQGITADGEKYSVRLNKDGTYKIYSFDSSKTFSKEGNLLNVIKNGKTYDVTKHTYGTNLQTGNYLNTGSVDLNSLQGNVSINGKIENSEQGELGDCFFLAQINALSDTDFGKEAIKNSIIDNNDGTYTVKLKGANKKFTISKQEILYAKTLTNNGKNTYSKGDDDMVLLELAFERYFNQTNEFIDDDFIKESKQELLKTKNSKGEVFECRTQISYGGFGGDFANYNSGTDIAFLLTGKQSFKGFPLDKDNKDTINAILKLKASNKNNIAITFGLGELKDSSNNKVAKEYKDFYSDRHLSHIKSVALDDNENITSVTITNPWDNNKTITLPYEKFMNEWISKTKDNDMWITSNSKEVNTQIEELSKNNAQKFSENLKSQKNSGDIYKMFKEDKFTTRAEILKNYGGMKKVLDDLLKETPAEWSRLQERGHTNLSLEEYQNKVINVFINDSGLFKDITPEEEKLIQNNFEVGIKHYCITHGYKY